MANVYLLTGNMKTQDKPRSNDRNEGELEHETQEVVLSFIGDDSTSSSVPQTSKPAGSQHPMQGEWLTFWMYSDCSKLQILGDMFLIYFFVSLGMPRSSSFEQNVLATLNSLNETINQMKANPSATQTEVCVVCKQQLKVIVKAAYNQGDLALVALASFPDARKKSEKTPLILLGAWEEAMAASSQIRTGSTFMYG